MNFGTAIRAERNKEYLIPATARLPISFDEWQKLARERLDIRVFDYAAGGAGNEGTLRNNRKSFDRWGILQKLLVDVSQRDLSIEINRSVYPFPVGLAPVGRQMLFHKEGELASAKASAQLGVPYIHSMVSSYSLESIASTSSPRWLQLFLGHDRDVLISFIKRAEEAGFSAIVVVFDRPEIGWRERDLRNTAYPVLSTLGTGNFDNDPIVIRKYGKNLSPQRIQYLTTNPGNTYKDVQFFRSATKLPLIIKGVVRSDDAKSLVDLGADGLIVSNHGGRHLDAASAALDSLIQIADETGKYVPIMFDSGVRTGADVFKAIALGAKMVFIGRPYVYGLAVAGMYGVQRVLENIIADFDLTMGNAGVNNIKEVQRNMLEKISY